MVDTREAATEIHRLRETLEWYANAGDNEKAIDCGDRARIALAPPVAMYAVSLEEGKPWTTFNAGTGKNYNTVHAIRFDDGRIWDCVNGWRQRREE